MCIYKATYEDMSKVALLFAGWEETLIWSCLQSYMGSAWVDNINAPTAAQIVTADFCFFAGKVNEALIRNKPEEYQSKFVIMVPENEEWATQIEKIYEGHVKKVTRYAIKKEADVFDVEKLKVFSKAIPQDYELKRIDEQLYHEVRKNNWSSDLCSQFDRFKMYEEKGLGVVALHKGEVVSGASSYTSYREGIEIEIDTRADYRRQGLALACGAKLILECLQRNLYPSWDAQNKASVALAQKLGYHLDKEYTAYEITAYGNV